MKCVVLCIFFSASVHSAVVPFITPCLWSDSACILNSANKAVPYFIEGIKEFGVPPLDPLFIKESISKTGDLELKFENLEIVGLSKAKLVKIERDNEKSTLSIIVETPLKGTGTYTADGKLLFIDFEGHGDFELKSDKLQLSAVAKLKKFEKDGKSYYTFDEYDFSYEIMDEFFFKFENLFNGDKAKADAVIALIQQNWRELIPEVGGPIIKQISDTVINAFKEFFENVPANELELPE